MLILGLFAFVSGLATLLSPCVLPLLPVILSGSARGGRARPVGIVAGFALGFGLISVLFSAAIQALGLGAEVLRYAAVAVFLVFGLVLLVPALGSRFELASASLIARFRRETSPKAQAPSQGFWSGIPVGLSLGIVWAPCVGPIMGSVIGLAATRKLDAGAILIALSYTLGTSLGMLAVMLGGKALAARIPALARRSAGIQRFFGALLLVVAVITAFGLDRRLEAGLLAAFPNYGSGLTAIESSSPARRALEALGASRKGPAGAAAFKGIVEPPEGGTLGEYGPAPELVPGGSWLGSTPLTMAGLRGKVVLVDFWTYSCVNCLRTLPYLKAWRDKYEDAGLVVIGVHSPEFAFEKDSGNVSRAMRDLGVAWPVMQDNDYATWTAYSNQYWPAHYFIDAKGRVRYAHYGEGGYADSERVIRELLAEAGAGQALAALPAAPAANSGEGEALSDETPETYLGYLRASGLVSTTQPLPDAVADYLPVADLPEARWTLAGKWKIGPESIESEGTTNSDASSLELSFRAKDLFLVLDGAEGGAALRVLIDGEAAPDGADVHLGLVVPTSSRLYTLATGLAPGPRRLRLEASGKVKLYAFTFG
jgi:cytochrome c biogenesis protein CcdA/thiol-disulfide isomerase/thioredoxin